MPPRARTTDPTTSHEAAGTVHDVSEAQARILSMLHHYGNLSDVEIAQHWHRSGFPPISPSGLRTRRAELVSLGKVRDSGVRVTLPTGRHAIAWQVTS